MLFEQAKGLGAQVTALAKALDDGALRSSLVNLPILVLDDVVAM